MMSLLAIYIYIYIYIYILHILVKAPMRVLYGNIAQGVGSRNSYSMKCSQVLYEASRHHPQCQYGMSKTSAVFSSLNL